MNVATARRREARSTPFGPGGQEEWVARRFSNIMLAIRADDAEAVHSLADEVLEHAPGATDLLELGAEYAARGADWARVVRYRAALTAARGDDEASRVALVRALTRAGATQAALDLVDRLLEKAPIGAGYRRLRLEVLLADGSTEAVTNLAQILMETPANDTAAFMADVAQILAQSDNLEIARDWVETSRARHAGNLTLARLAATLAYRQGRWPEAEAQWRQLAESGDPAVLRESRVFLARIAVATQRTGEATEIYREVLEDDPANERAVRHVIRQQIAARKIDDAQEVLARFEARVGRTPPAVRLRAMVAMGQRDPDGAISEYRAGLAAWPRDVELRCRFADLLDTLGDSAAVDAVLAEAEALAPRDPQVLSRQLNAGVARGLSPRGLLALADRLLSVRPYDPTALRQKANLLIRLNERHEAVGVMREALRNNPGSVPLWTGVISNLVIVNEREAAEALLAQARARFCGETAPALMALAEILEAADRELEAADLVERAASLEPDLAAARVLAARLWEEQGLYRRARPHLLAAQALDAGRDWQPLTFARVSRALNFVDAHPMEGGEKDHFPEALFERVGRMAVRRRFVEAEPTVLHVSSSLAAGGSERQVALTVQGLAHTHGGLRPEMVVQDTNPLTGRDFFRPQVEAAGVSVTALRDLRARGAVRELLATYGELREEVGLLAATPTEVANIALPLFALILERRPRVVHLWQDAVIAAGGLAALLAGVPLIVLSTRSTRPIERQRARPYLPAAYRALLGYEGAVMLNNSLNGARDYADWLGVDAGRIRTVYNGYLFEEMRSRLAPAISAHIRRQLSAGREDVVIGGVMRLSFEKRPDLWTETVMALARAHPGVRGVLVGEGPMRAELEERVGRAGLGGRIQFVGRQSPIEPWMGAMDILYLSSLTEGLPNVLIEAQALGVAVATLGVGGAPETVKADETGLVIDSSSAQEIATAMAPLVTDAGLRRRFGAAGPAWTETQFGLRSAIGQLSEIYAHY